MDWLPFTDYQTPGEVHDGQRRDRLKSEIDMTRHVTEHFGMCEESALRHQLDYWRGYRASPVAEGTTYDDSAEAFDLALLNLLDE